MEKLKKFIPVSSIFIILLISLLYFQNCAAQFYEDHIILNPYQTQYPAIGRTMGGATVALPDSAANITDNPAGIAQIRKIKLLFSAYSTKGSIDFESSPTMALEDQQWTDALTLGTFSAAIPLRLVNQPLTVAASYNANIPYEFKIKKDFFETITEYNGHLKTVDLGIGWRLSSRFSMGLGWIYWFGKRAVNAFYYWDEDRLTKRTLQYSGVSLNVGFQTNISKRMSAGATIYFPSQLEINHSEILPGGRENSYKMQEKFQGGFRLGLAEKITSSLTLGLEYAYQPKFSKQFFTGGESDYSSSRFIAVGLEQNIRIKSIFLPLYIMYRNFRLPVLTNEIFLEIVNNELKTQPYKNAISHLIEIGGNIKWRNFTTFFSARWQQSGKYYRTAPPIT
ncbi:outer membrane protein transport protein [candidate division KSB1 bacterium]|nr:outer membrane protein transport protein [candidate division KSB1 bacterium]